MGIGMRVFFVESDDRLKRISLRRFEGLMDHRVGMEPLPEYAGQRLRYAFVILETENRKPVAITHIDCAILKFDETGRVDSDDWNRQGHLAVEVLPFPLPENRRGPVIDARRRFSKKLYAQLYRWQPSSQITKAIENAIFGQKRSPLRLV